MLLYQDIILCEHTGQLKRYFIPNQINYKFIFAHQLILLCLCNINIIRDILISTYLNILTNKKIMRYVILYTTDYTGYTSFCRYYHLFYRDDDTLRVNTKKTYNIMLNDMYNNNWITDITKLKSQIMTVYNQGGMST